METYKIIDTSKSLLDRFYAGEKQVIVEYQESNKDGKEIWIQKTVLMSQDTVYDNEKEREHTVVRGIIMFRNTSEFHEKDQKEKEQLQASEEEAKRILISSRKQAEQERKKLLADTQDEMVTIAMLAARKAVGNNINEEKEKALFEDLLKKVGEA